MHAGLGRIIIYSRRIPEMVAFYQQLFGYAPVYRANDRIVELRPTGPGATVLLHPASAGQRDGQATVKLVFDVEDVSDFCRGASTLGIVFGPVHTADGYAFANTKDPCGNSVSVSSRAYRSSVRDTSD